jgi:predicted DNA-binding transcriptional regulator YafY
MARNDRIARLLKVLVELSNTRRGLPLRTLADRGGWKLRSLYRDIEAIEKAGIPVEHEEGRYRIMSGWAPPAGLAIDAEELLALHIARQQAVGFAGSRVAMALDRLYGKLATPPRGTGTLVPAGLGAAFSLARPDGREYAAFRQTVATLDRAIRDRLVVSTVYEALSGEVTRRKLEPVQLHWDGRLETLYLIAYCRLRQDMRVFAVHRFRAVSAGSRERFEPRAEVTSESAVRHAFRLWRAESVTRVRLRFSGRGARVVADRRWHPSQRTKRDEDGTLLFEAEVAGLEEITAWILSFGADCGVLEPEELRQRVRGAHLDGVEANDRRARRALR